MKDRAEDLVRQQFPTMSEEEVEELATALIDMAELALEAALSKQHRQKDAGKK